MPDACQVLSMDKRHSSCLLTRDQDEYLVAVRWGTASKRGAVRSKVRAVAVEAHGWDGEL